MNTAFQIAIFLFLSFMPVSVFGSESHQWPLDVDLKLADEGVVALTVRNTETDTIYIFDRYINEVYRGEYYIATPEEVEAQAWPRRVDNNVIATHRFVHRYNSKDKTFTISFEPVPALVSFGTWDRGVAIVSSNEKVLRPGHLQWRFLKLAPDASYTFLIPHKSIISDEYIVDLNPEKTTFKDFIFRKKVVKVQNTKATPKDDIHIRLAIYKDVKSIGDSYFAVYSMDEYDEYIHDYRTLDIELNRHTLKVKNVTLEKR